jgi:carboxypeptidase Taq
MTNSYTLLEKQFLRLSRLSHAETFLSWDQQVMMPAGGAEERALALAELSRMSHELITAEPMADWLAQAQTEFLDPEQQANLREMRRKWLQSSCLPAELVQAKSLAASRCEHAWRIQRANNDWAGFMPLFSDVVRLAREEAQARLAAATDTNCKTPYDALLDIHAAGDSSSFIAQAFNDLKAQLPGLIQEVTERQKGLPQVDLTGHYDFKDQERLSRFLLPILGFDFKKGRLDVSTHPFSTGVKGDHRITTRYQESEIIAALMATVHETGHASYEAGLPEAWFQQPVGQARSTSIHESQSLLFEKQLFLAKPFIQFLTPVIHQHFPTLSHIDSEQLWQALTRVKPGFIRVNADEVTYPMHVILRYEIESRLINGDMEAADIPDAWHEKMQAYLGLSTRDDYRNGCMQDIHWPSGAFGYFPSYTLGALNAAQLFASLKASLPDLDSYLATGDITPIREWLAANVWSKGSFLTARELMTQATGEGTNARHFIEHIRQRYLTS